MTASQIRYLALVCLHTKFHAVRLMQAGPDAIEMAQVFLEIFYPIQKAEPATCQDAEDLLVLVESGYDQGWSRRFASRGCARQSDKFKPYEALRDLSKTTWFERVLDQVASGRADAAERAVFRFLWLRERIVAFSQMAPVELSQARLMVAILREFLSTNAASNERNRIDAKSSPLPPPRRRRTRRGYLPNL